MDCSNFPNEGLGVWLVSGREHWKRGGAVSFGWCTEKRGGGMFVDGRCLSSNEAIFFLTLAIRQSKNFNAKLADPTGCPRSLKLALSSTGIAGAVMLVG